MSEADPLVALDVRGRPCPVPIIELARAIRGVEHGAVVRLLADDPAAERDIEAWCEATGHHLLALATAGGLIRAEVQKRPRG